MFEKIEEMNANGRMGLDWRVCIPTHELLGRITNYQGRSRTRYTMKAKRENEKEFL